MAFPTLLGAVLADATAAAAGLAWSFFLKHWASVWFLPLQNPQMAPLVRWLSEMFLLPVVGT